MQTKIVASCDGGMIGFLRENAETGLYVAAKATYIRLLHGKIDFLVFFSALAP